MNFSKELRKNKVFETVAGSSRELRIKSFVVGGFVRDLILGRVSKDIDFVCVGSGSELARTVARQLGNPQVTVFKNFGTAMIREGEFDLEFVGARKESYKYESRKPLVEDGTLEDDQRRRDFTINAMAISLNEEDYGELIDLFDGLNHLKNKIIMTPQEPSLTFSDDPLRMMRSIQFIKEFGSRRCAATLTCSKP